MEEIKLPHLFIDTCIIFGDYQLNSNIFKKILAYKRCTNCRVFIPEICVLELIEHYRRNILGDEGVEKIVNNLDKKVQEANKYIYKGAKLDIIKPHIDILSLVEGYEKYLRFRLNSIYGFTIIPISINEQGFMSILTKAIKGKKPFGPKDQGLKDSLVRSAYMDIASTSDNVAFISNNTDDFSNNDKLDFHQDLIDELITQGNGNHFYYTSINRVWEKYISDLEPFIDIKKIEEIIDKSTIKQLLENTMNKQEVNVIDSPLHNVTIDDFNIIGPVEFTEYNRIRVKYKSDSYTKITLDLEAEYEYDVSVYGDWYKASSITTSGTGYVECSIDLELNMTTLNMSFIEDSFVLTSFSVRTYDICSGIEDELNEDKKIKELERYHDTI